MEQDLFLYLVTSLLILIVSTVFSMLGLGGGMLYVPIFHWLGFPVKAVAIPMALLLNGVSTLLAFARYAREGLVDFRSGMPAAVAALLTAPIGAWSSQFVSHGWLLGLFAAVTGVAGAHSLAKSGNEHSMEYAPLRRRLATGMSAGALAGFVGGLLGIGGGVIVAPLLMGMGYPTKVAVATTAFIVTFSSFSGYLGHITRGTTDFTLLAVTIVPVILGSQLGSWYMAKKAKPAWIRKFYGVLLLVIAAKLFSEVISD